MSKAYIVWKDGKPYPANRDMVASESISEITRAAVSTTYEPRVWCSETLGWNCKVKQHLDAENYPIRDAHYVPADEERFRGLTLLEVGSIRRAERYAHGSTEDGDRIENRLLGKPMQQTQNLNVNVTYKDYLNKMTQKRVDELKSKHAHLVYPDDEAQPPPKAIQTTPPDTVPSEIVDVTVRDTRDRLKGL